MPKPPAKSLERRVSRVPEDDAHRSGGDLGIGKREPRPIPPLSETRGEGLNPRPTQPLTLALSREEGDHGSIQSLRFILAADQGQMRPPRKQSVRKYPRQQKRREPKKDTKPRPKPFHQPDPTDKARRRTPDPPATNPHHRGSRQPARSWMNRRRAALSVDDGPPRQRESTATAAPQKIPHAIARRACPKNTAVRKRGRQDHRQPPAGGVLPRDQVLPAKEGNRLAEGGVQGRGVDAGRLEADQVLRRGGASRLATRSSLRAHPPTLDASRSDRRCREPITQEPPQTRQRLSRLKSDMIVELTP